MTRGPVDNYTNVGRVNSRNVARIQAAIKSAGKHFGFRNEGGYFYDERNFPVDWKFYLNTSLGGEYIAVPQSISGDEITTRGEKGGIYVWHRGTEDRAPVIHREGKAPEKLPESIAHSASFYQHTLRGLSREELIELLMRKFDYTLDDFFGMTRRECFNVALRRFSEKAE